MSGSRIDNARRIIVKDTLNREHSDLPQQHGKLENKHRSGSDTNRKQRLRDPDGKSLVVHVHSPLI
jgi:hypothetical protein